MRIEISMETVFISISILMFAKGLLDWYIDYRIDKKEKGNKENRCHLRKDKRR